MCRTPWRHSGARSSGAAMESWCHGEGMCSVHVVFCVTRARNVLQCFALFCMFIEVHTACRGCGHALLTCHTLLARPSKLEARASPSNGTCGHHNVSTTRGREAPNTEERTQSSERQNKSKHKHHSTPAWTRTAPRSTGEIQYHRRPPHRWRGVPRLRRCLWGTPPSVLRRLPSPSRAGHSTWSRRGCVHQARTRRHKSGRTTQPRQERERAVR